MGSAVSVGARTEHFVDLDLAIVIGLLAEASRGAGNSCALVERQVAQWHDSLPNAGFGCIDVDLEAIVASEAASRQLLALLDAVRDTLLAAGDSLPRSRTEPLCRLSGVRLGQSYPTHLLTDSVQRLRSLVSHVP